MAILLDSDRTKDVDDILGQISSSEDSQLIEKAGAQEYIFQQKEQPKTHKKKKHHHKKRNHENVQVKEQIRVAPETEDLSKFEVKKGELPKKLVPPPVKNSEPKENENTQFKNIISYMETAVESDN